MKIVIISDAWHPQVNGVVNTLSKTKELLEKKGHNVLMITPNLFKTFPCPTYPEIRLSFFPGNKVKKLIKEFNPDAIHIATEGPLGLAGRNYVVKNGLVCTTSFHTKFAEYIYKRIRIPLFISYGYLKWFHSKAHKILVPTKSVIEDLKKWNINNTAIWPRGVDFKLFKPPLQKKKNDKPILINIGRVAIEKNLEAFLKLDLNCEKWIVGDGPDRHKLEKKYPNVKFFGEKKQHELHEYYGKADLFVFPSKTDTFGLVLLEAMACGLPVAAFPVAGPINVIGKSGAGVLNKNLKIACLNALKIPASKPLQYVKKFTWENVVNIFESNLQNSKKRDPKTYVFKENPHKKNTGLKRLYFALINSLSGFIFAFKEESAFRQELLLTLILIPLAFIFPTETTEKLLMIGSIMLLLIIEFLNSSIEATIDRISFSHHDLSKRAKDLGSAAVLCSLAFVFVTYVSILKRFF